MLPEGKIIEFFSMCDDFSKVFDKTVTPHMQIVHITFRIAKLAKAQDLDAIHDTVHEMARDEARHGQGFAALLKRYFGK